MQFYTISAKAQDNITTLYLNYDNDEQEYYWDNKPVECTSVLKLTDAAVATNLINSLPEFNEIINANIGLLLPKLLRHIIEGSIKIEQNVISSTFQVVDTSSIYTDYRARKVIYDAKLKELKEI
jgi:hypothetical protein